MVMNNKNYESPEIKVINIEPNEDLMDTGASQGFDTGGPGGMGE